jgi:hypothetical protein
LEDGLTANNKSTFFRNGVSNKPNEEGKGSIICITVCIEEKGFKGTVQRKLTGVLSGINRKLMICHCSDGYSFFNLKGLRSLKSKNVFSALTGTLL